MHSGFLLPLFTALIAGYLFKRCADEVAYLAAAVTAISLIVSLLLAPWQIQFLLLIFVLVSTKRLLEQTESKMRPQQNNQRQNSDSDRSRPAVSQPQTTEHTIKCKYRGVCYQVTDDTAEFIEGEITGKYRGIPWRIHQIKNNSVV